MNAENSDYNPTGGPVKVERSTNKYAHLPPMIVRLPIPKRRAAVRKPRKVFSKVVHCAWKDAVPKQWPDQMDLRRTALLRAHMEQLKCEEANLSCLSEMGTEASEDNDPFEAADLAGATDWLRDFYTGNGLSLFEE